MPNRNSIVSRQDSDVSTNSSAAVSKDSSARSSIVSLLGDSRDALVDASLRNVGEEASASGAEGREANDSHSLHFNAGLPLPLPGLELPSPSNNLQHPDSNNNTSTPHGMSIDPLIKPATIILRRLRNASVTDSHSTTGSGTGIRANGCDNDEDDDDDEAEEAAAAKATERIRNVLKSSPDIPSSTPVTTTTTTPKSAANHTSGNKDAKGKQRGY